VSDRTKIEVLNKCFRIITNKHLYPASAPSDFFDCECSIDVKGLLGTSGEHFHMSPGTFLFFSYKIHCIFSETAITGDKIRLFDKCFRITTILNK
jgi:hypothetical protein